MIFHWKNTLKLSDDSEIGCLVECDLHFRRHVHDKFKELPPAPKSLRPDVEWFSEYQKMHWAKYKSN